MNLRTLVSLCASLVLMAGCDRLVQESRKKPESAAALPQTTAAPEAMQTMAPEPEPVAEAPAEPAREPLRVGGLVTRPEVISRVPPDFGNGKVRITGVFITVNVGLQ